VIKLTRGRLYAVLKGYKDTGDIVFRKICLQEDKASVYGTARGKLHSLC
jgi:hypothetical protein